MYETVTYEAIVRRMLQRATENAPGLDTRPSTPLYASVAPAGVEIQDIYIEMDWILEQIFAGTAVREYLIRRCAEWGITPKPATKAILQGEFNIDINTGSRFSTGTLNYVAVARVSQGVYEMECETAGEVGNTGIGTLIPIEYIPGLTKAELTKVLQESTDEESTGSLRSRFLAKAQLPSTSGNIYDYYNWAMAVAGVGAAKVFPLASGPGTVTVVITDSNIAPPGADLVSDVYSYIEERRPIGCTLTVAGAVGRVVDISANVLLGNGVGLAAAQNSFAAAVRGYLAGQAFGLNYVSLARIGNVLLDVPGVEDYDVLTLNGSTANIALADTEIAAVGTVRLGVM